MSMDDKALTRLAKEHAANVSAWIDAAKRVVDTLGKLAGEIENQTGAPLSGGPVFRKCDRAAELVDKAEHAICNALEPD